MGPAFTIFLVTALLAYAAGKLLEDQPIARITQGLIAVIGALFIVWGTGWL